MNASFLSMFNRPQPGQPDESSQSEYASANEQYASADEHEEDNPRPDNGEQVVRISRRKRDKQAASPDKGEDGKELPTPAIEKRNGDDGQGSTQSSSSSGGTKSSNNKNNSQVAAIVSADSQGEGIESTLRKDEGNLAASTAPPPPVQTILKDGSRKSVRILEPATGSSGRMSSCDIDDGEDFLIDTAAMSNNNDPGAERSRRYNDSNSSDHKSFLRELAEVPTEENWDKNPKRSWLWKFRIVCGKLVENPYVQLGIIILIIINAIFMGIATFDFVTENPAVDKGFSSLDRAFLIVFTIELALQLIYRSVSYFTDAWLVFDFVIVIISWSLESLQIVRAFRIFRAFRLVTRIGPLRELVMAIGAVMPRMYAIAMLLLLIFYIFAVLFTELFRDVNTETNYFGSLDVSLFTCMELMTLEWAGITRETMAEKSWAWAPILAFISVTGFIVFNLIVAVVCDAVAVVDREVQAERMGEIETDTTKLEKAQERIWDMTEHVERMMHAQKELQDVLLQLNSKMEDLTGRPSGVVQSRQSFTRISSPVRES